MKVYYKLPLTERTRSAGIIDALIFFDGTIAIWRAIVKKGDAEIETFSIVSPNDFRSVIESGREGENFFFKEFDYGNTLKKQFKKARQQWERIRALGKLHGLKELDVPYIHAIADGYDVFLMTDQMQNSIVYNFRLMQGSYNETDIGKITIGESVANLMREDNNSSYIASFYGLSILEKTTFVVLTSELEEIVEFFLQNPFLFDGEPNNIKFGVINWEKDTFKKYLLILENGEFKMEGVEDFNNVFTIYEFGWLNTRPPICVPDFPYALWWANRNNIG